MKKYKRLLKEKEETAKKEKAYFLYVKKNNKKKIVCGAYDEGSISALYGVICDIIDYKEDIYYSCEKVTNENKIFIVDDF